MATGISHRTLNDVSDLDSDSDSVVATESVEEREALLADEEYAEHLIQLNPCPPNPYAHLPVYTTIHR